MPWYREYNTGQGGLGEVWDSVAVYPAVELHPDPECEDSSKWTLGAGWYILGTNALLVAPGTSETESAYVTVDTIPGHLYFFTFVPVPSIEHEVIGILINNSHFQVDGTDYLLTTNDEGYAYSGTPDVHRTYHYIATSTSTNFGLYVSTATGDISGFQRFTIFDVGAQYDRPWRATNLLTWSESHIWDGTGHWDTETELVERWTMEGTGRGRGTWAPEAESTEEWDSSVITAEDWTLGVNELAEDWAISANGSASGWVPEA